MKVDSRFHCFACQADGDVIDFVGRLFQLSPYKAVEKLKEDFGKVTCRRQGAACSHADRPPTGSSCWTITAVCSVGGSDTHRSHPQKDFTPASLKRLKNLDIVEYYLDCSVLPDPQTENELRKYWEGLHERLEKEERRLA